MKRANDRHLTGKRAQYNGAQTRKRAKERQRKENEAIAKMRKVSDFFPQVKASKPKCMLTLGLVKN